MAARPSLEQRLADIAALRDRPVDEAARALLRKELGSKNGAAVAAAAQLVGELGLEELGKSLVVAFSRLLRDPIKSDPRCVAKIALVEALAALGAPTDDLFLAGLRHRQLEPVWGGRVDTGARLRGACALALIRMQHPDAVREVALLLADPEREARAAAACALGGTAQVETAIPLLRFKAALGDDEPEVVRECLTALLSLDGERSVPFVTELLGREGAAAESAALALGASRLPDAFVALRDFHQERAIGELRRVVALALAMLRSTDAEAYLLEVVEQASSGAAIEAVDALAIQRHDPAVRARVAAAVTLRADEALSEAFAAAFPPPG